MGHIHRKAELERAFSVASLHCFFNLSAVALLFPIEWTTGFLSRTAAMAADGFQGMGGMRLSNPLKAMTDPTIQGIAYLCDNNGWVMLIVTMCLTFGMLVAIVKILRSLVLKRLESFFDTHLFRNAGRAMLSGCCSRSPSRPVPCRPLSSCRSRARAFCVSRRFTLLPWLKRGDDVDGHVGGARDRERCGCESSIRHLLFNLIGILIIWPIPFIREIPLKVAGVMGRWSFRNRFVPLVTIALVYFIIPAVVILIIR